MLHDCQCNNHYAITYQSVYMLFYFNKPEWLSTGTLEDNHEVINRLLQVRLEVSTQKGG